MQAVTLGLKSSCIWPSELRVSSGLPGEAGLGLVMSLEPSTGIYSHQSQGGPCLIRSLLWAGAGTWATLDVEHGTFHSGWEEEEPLQITGSGMPLHRSVFCVNFAGLQSPVNQTLMEVLLGRYFRDVVQVHDQLTLNKGDYPRWPSGLDLRVERPQSRARLPHTEAIPVVAAASPCAQECQLPVLWIDWSQFLATNLLT